MYKCGRCKKVIKELEEKFVRCPECGYRILFKERPPVEKKISTD